MEVFATRLLPCSKLKQSLLEIATQYKYSSAFIVTTVGSTSSASIRLADCKSPDHEPLMSLEECCEIVSLVGTLSYDPSTDSAGCHLHISLAKADGSVIGGHLMEATIHTTAEIVIGYSSKIAFTREMDDRTGFKELVVSNQK
jgi:predicted DNA-binding protein with PD1-like motif